MGVRINTNVEALNAQRNLQLTAGSFAKSVERLSSGLRINRAADDAAGLTISEKLRGQARGLNQAVRNSQDGISLIQTAEGALGESHSILQRMRELAVQSASDTLTNTDRAAIQKEVASLTTEIDRIADTTEFNTKKLINGDISAATTAQGTKLDSAALLANATVGSVTGTVDHTASAAPVGDQNFSFNVDGAGAVAVTFTNGVAVDVDDIVLEINTVVGVNIASNDGGYVKISTPTGTGGAHSVIVAGAEATTYLGITPQTILGTDAVTDSTTLLTDLGERLTASTQNSFGLQAGDVIKIDGIKNGTAISQDTLTIAADSDVSDLLTAIDTFTGGTSAIGADGVITITGDNGTAEALSDIKLTVDDRTLFNNKMGAWEETQAAQDTKVDASLSLQIGANAGQTLLVGVSEMTVSALSLSSVDVSSQQGAKTAITVIDAAIGKVSSQRSDLGATQNRLEHTIANLGVASENMLASESRIRDVDLAQEMVAFTRSQILQQAGTAILAQANQAPNSVLQLLR